MQHFFLEPLGLSLSNEEGKSLKLYSFSNPDGEPRWLWNASNPSPDFLRFYAQGNKKAKLFAFLIRILFFFRLQHLVFRKKVLFVTQDLSHPLSEYLGGDFALFTGTIGLNRKLVLYAGKKQEKKVFLKIALTSLSQQLINNEYTQLQKLKSSAKSRYPHATRLNPQILLLEDLGEQGLRANEFTALHAEALSEMYANRDCQSLTFAETYIFQEAKASLKTISHNAETRIPSGILEKLEILASELASEKLLFGFSHTDFTPWNCFVKEGKIHFYDFELAKDEMPWGFDAFHFVLQQGILVEYLPWKSIKIRAKQAFQLLDKQEEHDWEKYLKAYLFLNLAYYLHIYEHQTTWHIQIHWLINTWNDALSDLLQEKKTSRQLIIGDVFDFLRNEDYASLKFPNIPPQTLSEYADIDILMRKDCASALHQYLQRHSLVQKIENKSFSYMQSLFLLLNNGESLALDCIWRLKRKELAYLEVEKILERSLRNDFGIKISSNEDTKAYLQHFYGLNHSTIPEKYRYYWGEENISIDEKRLYEQVKSLEANKGIQGWKNKFDYLLDTFSMLGQKKGIIVTFSGVDGAGKSTIIEKCKQEIEKKLRRKVMVIRHRPSLLPILSAIKHGKEKAEQKAASTLPRQGNNKSFIGSFLRFAYYYSDYLFGQFYVYFRHVLRGEVVLYDRYYFDFINDSLRSNIVLPQSLLRSGYTFLMEPDCNFFLYASPEVILARKKELDAESITTLTQKYRSLFDSLQGNRKESRYLPIENIDLDTTMHLIMQNIQDKLYSK